MNFEFGKLENKVEQKEKIKHFFGTSFEVENIEDGDLIPVGGSNFLSGNMDVNVRVDSNEFNQFLEEINVLSRKIDLIELKKWLNSENIDFDENLFALLFSFSQKLNEKYSLDLEKVGKRNEFFRMNNNEAKLSDIFNNNTEACMEISILAQMYLQKEKINSSLFNGDVLWNKDFEFSENHTFIVIENDGKEYIYDPSNPLNSDSNIKIPNIYSVDNFKKEISTGEKKFIKAKNLFTQKEAYYGANDGTNVSEKNIV